MPSLLFVGGIVVHCTGRAAADLHGFAADETVVLAATQVLLPGLVDTHTHAPQWENRGIGMDRPLLAWIDTYTRPTEKTFGDGDGVAARVYDRAVRDTLRSGTTTACYYGTVHAAATQRLASACWAQGQRALVGQPSMDETGHADYGNTSVADVVARTEQLIAARGAGVAPGKEFDALVLDPLAGLATGAGAVRRNQVD